MRERGRAFVSRVHYSNIKCIYICKTRINITEEKFTNNSFLQFEHKKNLSAGRKRVVAERLWIETLSHARTSYIARIDICDKSNLGQTFKETFKLSSLWISPNTWCSIWFFVCFKCTIHFSNYNKQSKKKNCIVITKQKTNDK